MLSSLTTMVFAAAAVASLAVIAISLLQLVKAAPALRHAERNCPEVLTYRVTVRSGTTPQLPGNRRAAARVTPINATRPARRPQAPAPLRAAA